MLDGFEPREGGVTVVFDLPDAEVAAAIEHLAALGVDARSYYEGRRQSHGGAPHGYVRMAIDERLTDLDDETRGRVEAGLVGVVRSAPFAAKLISIEGWTAGGGPDAGVREPRRPHPKTRSGATNLP